MFKLRRPTTQLALTCLVATLCVAPASSQDRSEAPKPADPAERTPDREDPTQTLIDALNKDDNGLSIDRNAMTIDLKGKVCLREAEFLEMLACTPDTREHESLIVLESVPSTIHTALLLLGLEAGSPAQWVQDGDGPDFKMLPPKGPEVTLVIVYEKDGETVEVPANEWVVNQKTGDILPDSNWLFAGSKVVDFEGKPFYVADSYGTAVSLVNFGDDLLARQTNMSDQNDSHAQTWGANTKVIPQVGTEVILRLKPVDKKPDAAEAEAKPGAEE